MDKQVGSVQSRKREWENGGEVGEWGRSQFGEEWWLWLADKRLSFSAPPDRMGRPCLLHH